VEQLDLLIDAYNAAVGDLSPVQQQLGLELRQVELEKRFSLYEVPRKLLRKQILDLDKCLSLALKTSVSVIHVLETLRRID
jgi:hypothetical protein